MAEPEPIVAIGLLSQRELAIVGQGLHRVYRIDQDHGFDDLLKAIDKAEAAGQHVIRERCR